MIDEKKLFTEIANSLTQKELKDYILKYCRNEKSQIITFLNYFEIVISVYAKFGFFRLKKIRYNLLHSVYRRFW